MTENQQHTRVLAHWPEIDGLRTLAVVPVLLFHLDRNILGGGFVGVDIFFVISGFLITSILLSDVQSGRLDFGRFYQRRIARIAPAFFLVLAVVLAIVPFVYSDQDIASAGVTSAFAALSLANIKYMLQGNYFQMSSDAQPSLHYWSLSVEEQFYLFYPLYLFAVIRWTRHALKITVLVAFLSFAVCAVTTRFNPVWAFYFLPMRGWELLVGGVIALARFRNLKIFSINPSWISWAGLALIGLCLGFIREGDHFPGAIAAIPVLGTGLVLAMAGKAGSANSLLANPLFVFIGKRSYSLYLWHWPIYSMLDYRFFMVDAVHLTPIKLGLTVIAALVTYELLERPARTYLSQPQNQKRAFIGFFVISIAIAAIGFQYRATHYLDARAGSIATGGHEIKGGDRARLVVIGDSQGAMYGGEIASLAREMRITVNLLAIPAGNELPGEPNSHWPNARAFVSQAKPDVIIIAQAWNDKLGTGEPLIEALKSLGDKTPIILLTQPPAIPQQATRDGVRGGAKPPFFEPAETKARRIAAEAVLKRFKGRNVSVVEIAPLFQGQDGSVIAFDKDGRSLYHDPGHLSSFGASKTRPILKQAIDAALAEKMP